MDTLRSVWVIVWTLAYAGGAASAMAQPRVAPDPEASWQVVDSLVFAQEEEAALAHAHALLEASQSAEDWPRYLHSLLRLGGVQSVFAEDPVTANRAAVQEAFSVVPDSLDPFLHLMLGQLYLGYARRFRHSVPLKPSSGQKDGLLTMSRKKVLGHAQRHLRAAVAPAAWLQETATAPYAAFFQEPTVAAYRPTLYDAFLYEVTQALLDEERPYRAAFFLRDTAWLGATPVFLEQPLDTSWAAQPFHWLQQAEAFRWAAGDTTAWLAAVAHRLRLVYPYLDIADATASYLSRLEAWMTDFPHTPLRQQLAYQYAHVLYDVLWTATPERLPIAPPWLAHARRQCANPGREPDQAVWGYRCQALLDEMLRPAWRLETNRYSRPNRPFLAQVSYRNINRLHVRAYRLTAEMTQLSWRSLRDTMRQWVPDTSFTVALPLPSEANEHTARLPLPALPAGTYHLHFSDDSTFANTEQVAFGRHTLTHVAALWGSSPAGDHEIYFIDRGSGVPLQGVRLEARRGEERRTWLSDEVGYVLLPDSMIQGGENAWAFSAFHRSDTLTLDAWRHAQTWDRREDSKMTMLTDRALYRPGQQVQFKLIWVQRTGERYGPVVGDTATVYLRTYRHTFDSLRLATNRFGSASGSFQLPSASTGTFWLDAEATGTGALKRIEVEAYRRPRFAVNMASIPPLVLGDTLVLEGQVRTLTGVGLGEAAVTYQLMRTPDEERNPERIPRRQAFSFEWSTYVGQGRTADDGTFTFQIPTFDASMRSDAWYHFEGQLVVTDATGETQEVPLSVRVGPQPLVLAWEGPARVDRRASPDFFVLGYNSQDAFQPVEGTVSVYRLTAPRRPYQPLVTPEYGAALDPADHWLPTERSFETAFPYEPIGDAEDLARWPIEERVTSFSFATTAGAPLAWPTMTDWATGAYRIVVTPKEEGTALTQHVTIYDATEETLPYPMFSWFEPLTARALQPGDTASFLYGSSLPLHLLQEVRYEDRLIERRWVTVTPGAQHRFELSVHEQYEGMLEVRWAGYYAGRLIQHQQALWVMPASLQLRWETFRSDLQPGQEERWRLRIEDADGAPVSAEVAVTLYDAALDHYLPHRWQPYLTPLPYQHRPWQRLSKYSHTALMGGVWYAVHMFGREGPTSLLERAFWNSTHQPTLLGRRGWLQGELSDDDLEAQFGFRRIYGQVLDAQTGRPLPEVTNVHVDENESSSYRGFFVAHLYLPQEDPLVFYKLGYADTLVPLVPGQRFYRVWMEPGQSRVADIRRLLYRGVDLYAPTGMLRSPELAVLPDSAAGSRGDIQGGIQAPMPVVPRQHFAETAFFAPHLETAADGSVTLAFTMPEAVTRWRLLAWAHTPDLRTGMRGATVVTRKPLMITPTAPRFATEGDTLVFTAQVLGLAAEALSGRASLEILDPETLAPVDASFLLTRREVAFAVAPQRSAAVQWRLRIPAGYEAVRYRIRAQAGAFTDGEEHLLPILPRTIPVTESQPFLLTKPGTHIVELPGYPPAAPATTEAEQVRLRYNASPIWEALWSLPYLRDFPHACHEQRFARYFGHVMALHLLRQYPAARTALEAYTAAVPASQEQDLFPDAWPVGRVPSEAAQRRRLAALLDAPALAWAAAETFKALVDGAEGDGWGWFPGMPPDRFITQHILAGLGHLLHLGVTDPSLADFAGWETRRAVEGMDRLMLADQSSRSPDAQPGPPHVSMLDVHYLYARSYFPAVAFQDKAREAAEALQAQIRVVWPTLPPYAQGLAALALHRLGDAATPAAILSRLRSHAQSDSAGGLYWRMKDGWKWYQGAIETQAVLIEAFATILQDTTTVDAMRLWLLRQKEVQHWPTTKATTEAVYALLAFGSDWTTPAPATLEIGGRSYAVETFAGYPAPWQRTWTGEQLRPGLGRVVVEKTDEVPAWGALLWTYLAQADTLPPSQGPFRVEKQFFGVPRGETALRPLQAGEPLAPGAKLSVVLTLHLERDMEYLHLTDPRAAGLEPPFRHSGYRSAASGLRYYQQTLDAATHFYFPRLSAGTHVLHYELRVMHAGAFAVGPATLESMYAPQYRTRSAGQRLRLGSD